MNTRPQTPENYQQDYVNSYGNKCPACKSEDISSAGALQSDAGIVWQDMECENCGANWQDIYKLEGFQNLQK